MLSVALIGAAFTIGDASGLLEKAGYEVSQKWIISAVFILFAIVVMVRLVRLQAQVYTKVKQWIASQIQSGRVSSEAVKKIIEENEGLSNNISL